MKKSLPCVFILLLLSCINLFAQLNTTDPSTPTNGNFESPGFLDTSRFVSPEMMSGSLHSVGAQTYNNGLQNIYQLTSGGTTTQVLTTPLLLQRIREIYAIDYLRHLSKTDAFTKALATGAGDKVNSVVSAVSNPIGTLRNLPKGASRFFGNIGEGIKGGASQNEGNALDSVTGMSKAKAQLAFKLGVSPFSDNQELQDQLSRVAWAMAGGGLVLTAVSAAIPGAVGTALTAVGGNQIIQNAVINTPPPQLRIANRKKLFDLGLDRDTADAFLMQPFYTPLDSTIIVDALSRIGAPPKAFLKEAGGAACQEDAFYFKRLAELLLNYHQRVAPIRSLHTYDGIICGLDQNGVLVVPVSLDYAIWSQRIAGRSEQFAALMTNHPQIKSLALWADGMLSDRLCQEFTRRNIAFRASALESK